MPQRRLSVAAESREVEDALTTLRAELEIPGEPPAEVTQEAGEAAALLEEVLERAASGDLAAADTVPSGVDRPRLVDARDIPFVTIDPPGSTDLDQAVHLRRADRGWHIDYAIASLAEVVRPGGALDLDVRSRAVTVYGPTGSYPLHPREISSGVCSLLPQEDRIALVWAIDLDAKGRIEAATVTRSLVRSRARLDYAQVQDAVDGRSELPGEVPADLPALLAQVGGARQARELARGGASLNLPEQEVEEVPGGYGLRLRSGLPAEDWNAQISLTTGIAAARIMARAGHGVLRTLPPADPRDVRRLRGTARGLGIDWAPEESYGEVLARLDAAVPAHAAFLDEATTLFRGSGYRVLDGPLGDEDETAAAPAAALPPGGEATDEPAEAPPADSDDPAQWRHAAIAARYAHVTAPLRRLVDRYGLEVCLAECAGLPVPQWVREGLGTVAQEMSEGTRVANRYERGAIDAVEALLFEERVGDVVDAVVVDVAEKGGGGQAQVTEPAARVRIEGEGLTAGTRIRARVAEVDLAQRRVVLTPA